MVYLIFVQGLIGPPKRRDHMHTCTTIYPFAVSTVFRPDLNSLLNNIVLGPILPLFNIGMDNWYINCHTLLS